MTDRYMESKKYLDRARRVTPGGAQTLSKMAARFPEGAYPVAVMEGRGARVTDVDCNEYVDWICGLGAITLGYNDEHVNAAVHRQVDRGAGFSLPHWLEVMVAEKLCQAIPCAEMVRFVNSGSEATEAAIRTARIATGKDIILTVGSGYHSWHSWFQAVKPWHPGVPAEYTSLVRSFSYNDLDSLDKQFLIARDNVAAVIMEPCLFDEPADGFLAGVAERCVRNGAMLIFDEVVCGGRWRLGGGQQYFGVTPDLATFGKGLANGYPIGFLCGKAEWMQHAELISGTFGGNPVSLAAMNAALNVYMMEPVVERMFQRGSQLQMLFGSLARKHGVPAVCDGYPCKPRIRFTCSTERENVLAMSLFLQETAAGGALFHPGGFNVCAALTDDDMNVTDVAIGMALSAVSVALNTGDWSGLVGKTIRPVVTVRQ